MPAVFKAIKRELIVLSNQEGKFCENMVTQNGSENIILSVTVKLPMSYVPKIFFNLKCCSGFGQKLKNVFAAFVTGWINCSLFSGNERIQA